MSRQTPATVICNSCRHRQDVLLYSSINVTLDPSLKAKVMRSSLYDGLSCGNCGQPLHLDCGFLYHDMKQKLILLYHTPEAPAGSDAANVYEKFREQGYIIRAVDSSHLLREKITIFDSGLNDEVIEALKKKILTTVADQDQHLYLFFHTYSKGLLKKTLDFHLFSDPRQIMRFSFPLRKLSPDQQAQLFDQEALRGKFPDGFPGV